MDLLPLPFLASAAQAAAIAASKSGPPISRSLPSRLTFCWPPLSWGLGGYPAARRPRRQYACLEEEEWQEALAQGVQPIPRGEDGGWQLIAALVIWSLRLSKGPPSCDPSGRAIRCWGKRWILLTFSGQLFTCDFLLAEVGFFVLWVDFLLPQNISGCGSRSANQHRDHITPLYCASHQGRGWDCLLPSTPASYRPLFIEFPDIVNPSSSFTAPNHGVQHLRKTFHVQVPNAGSRETGFCWKRTRADGGWRQNPEVKYVAPDLVLFIWF